MKSVKDGEKLDVTMNRPYTKLQNGKWVKSCYVDVRKPAGLIGVILEDSDSLVPLLNMCGNKAKALVCGQPEAGACKVRLLVREEGQDPNQAISNNVSELARLLMASEENDYRRSNKKKKESFVSAVEKTIGSPEHIKAISVERSYSAWGECADLIAENDRVLRKLAEDVIMSDVAERPDALQTIREYVLTSNPDRAMNFGAGFDDFRYTCNTDDRSMLNLAMRLCMYDGPSSVGGREYSEINFLTGESLTYAAFDLARYTSSRGLENTSVEDVQQIIMEERQREEERRQKEKDEWMQLYGQFLTQSPSVSVPGQIFVFCDNGEWRGRPYEDVVKERGGLVRRQVSGKTNYVVVYPFGRYDDWRVRDARIQQAKGKNVQIILPDDLEKALENG